MSYHLDVLLEERGGLLDTLLDAVGDVERDADAESLARLAHLPARARASWKAWSIVGAAGRRAAADDAADVVLCHEVERVRARAHHRLPALDRRRPRPRPVAGTSRSELGIPQAALT